MMSLSATPLKSSTIKQQTNDFINQMVLPWEVPLAQVTEESQSRLRTLVAFAHKNGLWGRLFPQQWGGTFERVTDYLEVGFEEGRTEFAPTIFGGLATVDAHMLAQYGSAFIKERFLLPLSRGEITSAYAMTEPDQPGSIPATLNCKAEFQDNHWCIHGQKWFICNAKDADYVTVLARTSATHAAKMQLTMFVVPVNTPGCEMKGSIDVLGRSLGQGEFLFQNVKLDDQYRLGEVGEGISIMQNRVALGRLLRSIHWLGLADRCLELMYQRIHSDKGQKARLAEKQLIRQHVFKSHSAIESAKLLLKKASQEYDARANAKPEDCFTAINVAKISASSALCQTSDSAVQIHGAEGLSHFSALGAISQVARTTRILDGADEALINAVGNQLIQKQAPKQE